MLQQIKSAVGQSNRVYATIEPQINLPTSVLQGANAIDGISLMTYDNTDNTLQYKHDAKGQDTVYTYDALKRVTQVQRYPLGKTLAEDQASA